MDIKSFLQDLQNIDPTELRADNIGRWPLAVRVMACVAAFVAVVVGYYFWQIADLNTDLSRAQREETQLKAQFSDRAFEAANLKAYQAQMIELQERLDILINQLPKDTEVPGLLEDITETGLSSGLEIGSILLQTEVAHDYYIELPISITASGGYHDFATFVSGVSGLPRIVTLHNFDIKKKERFLLDFSIIAKTYRYKDTEEDE